VEVRVEITKEGLNFIQKTETPFGLEDTQRFIDWGKWQDFENKPVFHVSDIEKTSGQNGLSKIVLVAESYQPHQQQKEQVTWVADLKTNVKSRRVFYDRVKRQIDQHGGLGYDIYAFIKGHSNMATHDQICNGIGVPYTSGAVGASLKALEDLGLIKRIKRGNVVYHVLAE
jgi:hypothetical protein